MAKMNSFWAQAFSFDKSKMEAWVGFRSALGLALSVLIGYFVNSPTAGLSIAIGALNVSFSDRSDAYSIRGKRMLTAAFFSSAAVFMGAASANNPILFFVSLVLISFLCGMLVVVDTVAADIGVVVVATFLIFSSQALTPLQALHLSLYAFGGGLLQALLSVGLSPLRKYRPQRRALSSLYSQLAELAVSFDSSSNTPLGSVQSIETQNQLATLEGNTDTEARRYRSLLSQAERLRVTLMSLNRIRRRLERESEAHIGLRLLAESTDYASRLLAAVAEVINFGPVRGIGPKYMTEIQERITKIHETRRADESLFYSAVLNDLTYQLESMAGKLRAIIELTEKTTPAGMEAAEKREAAKPLHLRYWSAIAAIRANCTFRSPGFRHAIRLALCMVIGEVLSHSLKISRPYWLPMTMAVVLKPDYASTLTRGFLRVAGTMIGLILATVLFHFLPSGAVAEIVLIFVFTFLVRWAGSANYGVFAMCVAGLVVVLIALTGGAPKDVIWSRGVNTLLGGVIALAVYWLWPTSEKLQMPEVIARMLEGYRDYLHGIVFRNISSLELDKIRQRSRVARASFQAAAGRIELERGSSVEYMKVLSAVTVATNRLAHASMSLEAGSVTPLSETQQRAYEEYTNAVESTLTLLCEALRGRDVPHSEFPDVRQAYVTFAKTQSQASEAFGFLYFETDRIANSLNTVTEYVLKYLHAKRLQNSI